MYYLYRHIRLDKNEVFYIGIGTVAEGKILANNGNTDKGKYYRAFEQTKSRSEHWKNIIALTEYRIEVIFHTKDIKVIKAKEIEYIALYKETLCNQTVGGSGIEGYSHTQECKDRISNTMRGVKKSKEVANKINAAKLKPIIMFNDTTNIRFGSIKEVALYLGNEKYHANISSVARGIRATAYGYKFKFEEDVELQDKKPVG